MGEQMTVLMRFVGDSALTPNAKVKIATMKHLSAVAQLMEPSQVLCIGEFSIMLGTIKGQMATAGVMKKRDNSLYSLKLDEPDCDFISPSK